MVSSLLCVLMVSQASSIGVVPRPMEVVSKPGKFELLPSTVVVAAGEAKPIADMFTAQFRASTGYPLRVSTVKPVREFVEFAIKPELKFVGDEGYRVSVRPGYVSVRAYKPAGLFYGLQTLRQLLPPQGESSLEVNADWSIAGVEITDKPRFGWRGMHLDVSRHFFSKEQVKQYIDLMALHKMNVFHWHLVDDGGWRIEIKKYPLLTQVGAWRTGDGSNWNQSEVFFNKNDGVAEVYGGYYTQNDIKEVVAYAKARFVDVVPEIEMPGHALPALWAYRNLACEDEAVNAVLPTWNAKFVNVFCAGREETFRFVSDVLGEVAALFPSKYIHIGGDEVDRRVWGQCDLCRQRMITNKLDGLAELQSYFIKRVETIVNGKGKTLIGWDEILDGGLAPKATVMSWRGEEGGIKAAQSGHDVVMSPTSHCYFDFNYVSTPTEKVYSYEPVPAALNASQAPHVRGAQGNVWTEWIEDFDRVEWMAFPRAAALSEVLWTQKNLKNYSDFDRRLKRLLPRYDALGVDYALEAPKPDTTFVMFTDPAVVSLPPAPPGMTLRYTLDGARPTVASPPYNRPFSVDKTTTVSFAYFTASGRPGDVVQVNYRQASGGFTGAVRPGWNADYFEGSFSKVPDFDGMEPVKSEVVRFIDLQRTGLTDAFAARYSGYIQIPKTGIYLASLTSDDGSQLYIDGALAIDHDGLHGPDAKRVKLRLVAGLYPIELRYFEQGGSETLKLEIAQEGSRLQPVPDSWIFHAAR